MKLLVLSPRFPYPLEKGDKLRIFHQLRLLQEHCEICLVSLTMDDVDITHQAIVEDITSQCHIIKVPQGRRRLSAAKALFTGTTLQTAYYYSAKAKKQIDHIITDFKPDHIYCQLIRMAPYVMDVNIPKTLDYMDAFGVGMKRRADVSKGIYKWLFNLEAKRLKRYEEKIHSVFDHHTIISEQDRKQIGNGNLPISVINNGIDTIFFAPIDRVVDHDIGFIGNMGYPPNIDAVEYLVNQLKLSKEYKILLAGARPHKRVKLLASNNVTITGWVDDVRKEYARCRIFVAPLMKGTGQQNKILEAMAMGIPCVTTSSVNNAIAAIPGEEILIADTEEEYFDKIKELLSDMELYSKIRKNGLQLVKEKFSWQHTADNLIAIFNK